LIMAGLEGRHGSTGVTAQGGLGWECQEEVGWSEVGREIGLDLAAPDEVRRDGMTSFDNKVGNDINS
jgi:hypothetical protein